MTREKAPDITHGTAMAEEIDRAIASGETFGMVLFPGSDKPVWFGPNHKSEGITMEIAPWLTPFSRRFSINTPLTVAADPIEMPIPTQSTSHADYIKGVTRVIESCTGRNGKTVYSRVICGEMKATTPGQVARQLFASHPGCLRFIYHTPQTGGWLGATPELLLDMDKRTGTFHTMALAGTRKRGSTHRWDDKNLRENHFVINYITASLAALGIDTEVSPLETVAYGGIEHLCSHITGRASSLMIPQIIDALNPTPALCGYPKADAIADITRFENHPRGCYGGIIGFSSETSYRAFVNLRCMHFDGLRYCIYGGGGITSQSVPDEEYSETTAKTALLCMLTEGSNHSVGKKTSTKTGFRINMPEKNITPNASPKTPTPRKYRLGVALSGGGARGFAHVGALKALEEAGLKPDIIAGVSAGSVAAVMYAAGVPLDDMLSLFTQTKFTDFCKLSINKGGGVFSLSRFKKFIETATGVERLEDLKIPTYIGVTDLDNGVPAEFHEGALGERVMASCSIPLVFQPVKINGTHYVDGGVLRNLPAWIIRDKCDKLIGINCSPLNVFRYKKSFLDIALRTYNLMAKANQFDDMKMCDRVIITPELSGYQVFNLKDINKVYLSGYAAAHRAIKDWQDESNGLYI